MRGLAVAAGVAVLAGAGYLAAWPVPVEPVAWAAPENPGYAGPHAVNERLAGLQRIELNGQEGPEHVALGPDGKVYLTVLSGEILRMQPDGTGLELFAKTGGRVLGFDFDADGNLIAADAMLGLLAIAPDGAVRVLADSFTGPDGTAQPIRYADGVAVAGDGKIYFTDASARFAPAEWGGTFQASVMDILENSATGSVLVHDPGTGTTELVLGGLSFANGIALSQDGRRLFVNETGRYRVWTVDASARNLGAAAPDGRAAVLLDNLPGYPDNLLRGRDGRIWLGFAKPRSPVVDRLAGSPELRKVTMRLPRSLWPVPKPYGHVIAFDEQGRIVADLQDPSGAYPESTGVLELEDRLYIMSLHAGWLGWMPCAGCLRTGS